MSQPTTDLPFRLERDAFGRLNLIDAQGVLHAACVPVRAFPIAAPEEGLSLVGPDGRERLWIEQLERLPAPLRELLQEELAQRELTPEVLRIHEVSTFSTPSIWRIDTDKGETRLHLGGEEAIRRLPDGALLIQDVHGLSFRISRPGQLDRSSRRLLERFL